MGKRNSKVKLKDINIETKENTKIEVIGGQVLSRVELINSYDYSKDEYDVVKIVNQASVKNGYIDLDTVTSINVLKTKKEIVSKRSIYLNRFTKSGDIVVKLNFPISACLIKEEEEGLLVPSFDAIIRGVNPGICWYLVAYLNSRPLMENIISNCSGSNTKVLTLPQLENILVPLKSDFYIKKLGETYKDNVKQEKLFNKITKLEKKKIDSTFNEILLSFKED